jgi:magnesium transporter
MSAMSNKMNEVMKVLTVFAAIFIPLTFIAGIYGMNFDIMPELNWEYGYLFAWGVMLTVVILLLLFFKRKKWL